MFEHYREPLAGRRLFIRRVVTYLLLFLIIIFGSLGVGVVGYRVTEHMSWLDALLNASMILGGMGPVDTLHTAAGKIFASLYALFAGVVFLVAVGVLIAPVFHRFLHAMQVAPEDVEQAEEEEKKEGVPGRKR